MGNFFIHCEFDICFYILADSDLMQHMVRALLLATCSVRTLLAYLFLVRNILGIVLKVKTKASRIGM